MKLPLQLLLHYIITTASINVEIKDFSLLSQALSKVISEVIIDFAVTFNVISINNNHESNDFRDNFMKEITKSPTILIRQQMLDGLPSLGSRGARKTSLFALQTFEDFLKFHSHIQANNENFAPRGIYIFVLTNGRIENLEKIFALFWQLQFYNINVIYENNKRLFVETFFPFESHTNCSNTHPVIINDYQNDSFTHDIKDFFPNKMKNLKQCAVRVATSNTSVPYIYMKTMLNGEKRLYGRDYDFIQTLAHTLNFRINFTYVGAEGYIFTNGTASGSFLWLLNQKADLTIADYWLKAYRLIRFDASAAYINEKLVFVLPVGSDLSAIEKLLYPLTFLTWLMLIACFFIGFIVIFVIKHQSKTVQNFVFGTRVKYPFFNMWIGLIGTLQHRMPGRNFSRFILTIFLLFCLIIRSAYQGKMYTFMQSNKKHSEPQTINEMIEREYKFTVLYTYADLIVEKARLGNIVLKPLTLELLEWAKQIKGDEKNTILLPYTQVYYKLIDNNTRNLMICREVFLTIPTVIYTIKNFYLLGAINDQIEAFNSAGLIDYWHSLAFDKKHMKLEISKQPKVLTVNHLLGVFEVWIAGYVISSIVFMLECVSAKWKNHGKRVTRA